MKLFGRKIKLGSIHVFLVIFGLFLVLCSRRSLIENMEEANPDSTVEPETYDPSVPDNNVPDAIVPAGGRSPNVPDHVHYLNYVPQDNSQYPSTENTGTIFPPVLPTPAQSNPPSGFDPTRITDHHHQHTHDNNHAGSEPKHHDGIRKSQIKEGDEDLYILKSQIVPPVCPKCPTVCPSSKAKCPPCPPCARCPEPSYKCKMVPNYSAANSNQLPRPILGDFSQFGM